jgi:hypothetical protein
MTLSHSWPLPALAEQSPAPPTTADALDTMPSGAVRKSTVASGLATRASAQERER